MHLELGLLYLRTSSSRIRRSWQLARYRPECEVTEDIALRSAPRLVIYGHVGFDISVVAGKATQSLGGAAYYAASAASLVNGLVGVVTVIGLDFPILGLQSLQIDTSGVCMKDGNSAVFYQEYSNGNQ